MHLQVRCLYNCPGCFWTFHKGKSWQQAIAVSEERRRTICQQLGLKHEKMSDRYENALLGIGAPDEISCSSSLAEGGGLCGFSTICFLLVEKSVVCSHLAMYIKLHTKQNQKSKI